MSYFYARDLPYEERMLWASVLRRAVFDYVLYAGVRARAMDWTRAYQYVFVPGQRYENGLGFEEVCELFNWDPDYLRRLTTKLTRSDVKKMETTQFRGDFVYDEVVSVVEHVEKWKTSGFAASFLPRFKFDYETRARIEPSVVYRESYIRQIPPAELKKVEWKAAS